MAENLCNNPKAQTSLEGKTFESPCGFFGCSYKDFIDWFSTLKRDLNIARSTYKKLEHYASLQENSSLTKDEEEVGKRLEATNLLIQELKNTKDDLTSTQYKELIEELKVSISQTVCDIETIQGGIEDRDGRYTPSGLADSRSSVFASPVFKWAAIGFAGWMAFRIIDNKTR